MPQSVRSTPVSLYLAVILLSIGLFVADLVSPLGIAEWILYLAIVVMCYFGHDKRLPLAAAALGTLFIAIGFVASADRTLEYFSVVNRSIGLITIWILAAFGYRYIGSRRILERQTWLNQGQMRLSTVTRGDHPPEVVAANVLRSLAPYVQAGAATLYVLHNKRLRRLAQWAFSKHHTHPDEIALGEGLLGQAAQDGEIILRRNLPSDYLPVASSLGSTHAQQVLIVPITAAGDMVGVLELGFTGVDSPLWDTRELMEQASETIGMAIRSAHYRVQLEELLTRTQQQSEELQVQQEELRVSNEELEERGRALMESQSRLEVQQSELEQANAQLEEHTQHLERQKQQLLNVQQALAANALELESANRYKSEFLANMSHELRTPLNSSLILSKLLADNRDGNLSEEQVRYANTIHSSNSDLLSLINDILDLSRVEAGHIRVETGDVDVAEMVQALQEVFDPLAAEKHLAFRVQIDDDAPRSLITDNQRTQQILRNLLANAFKFTHEGEVSLHVSRKDDGHIRFAVRDTGIGIPPEQHQLVFEAFRQADGTTRRHYGGSGLGLSISRQFALLLGGKLELESAPDSGSTFSLILPLRAIEPVNNEPTPHAANQKPVSTQQSLRDDAARYSTMQAEAAAHVSPPLPARGRAHRDFDDDRDERTRGSRLILVIEDDLDFARILYDVAHELDFDCIHAATAQEGVELAHQHKPCGILLDMGLPDNSGLVVLETLKRDSATRHIPIHVVSVADHTETALHLGAIGYSLKPAARTQMMTAIATLEERFEQRIRRILIIEDDETLRENIELLLSADGVEIVGTGMLADAREQLSAHRFDCVVMDLTLPDGSGYDLLEDMARQGREAMPPVIVYTGRALNAEDERRLRKYSRSIIIKGARSPERLLDEVTLFLHSVEADLPPDRQRMLKEVRQRDSAFEGRTILLVEDDIRNIFALSQVIEPLGAHLEIARNGQQAIDRVADGEHIDLVLMDIMMPVLDGLTATQEIRKLPGGAKLPIIALTAKAMEADRQRCLDAGANDYISKPVDIDKLLSLCRVWLPH